MRIPLDLTDFEIFCRLRDRLTKIDLGESGFSIDKHVASIASMAVEAVTVKGKSTLGLKAREHYGLMMVFY